MSEKDDMAIEALKKTDWFKDSVRDIRAFKVEDWSDFTPVFKEQQHLTPYRYALLQQCERVCRVIDIFCW